MTTFTSRGVPMAEDSDAADIAARVNPVAQLHHDRPGVSPLTTTQRNALAGSELWDGRVIYNTILDRLQYYDLTAAAWVDLAGHDVFAGNEGVFRAPGFTNPPAGTRKIRRECTVSATVDNTGGGLNIPLGFTFPNGIASVVVTPYVGNAAYFLTLTAAASGLNYLNGVLHGATTGFTGTFGVIAVGW